MIRWFDQKDGDEKGSLPLNLGDCTIAMDEDDPKKFCIQTCIRDLWLEADDEDHALGWIEFLRDKLG